METNKKVFYTQGKIASSKYTVSMHDGVQTHKDGSPFYGIALFNNKKKLALYLKKLTVEGYTERKF